MQKMTNDNMNYWSSENISTGKKRAHRSQSLCSSQLRCEGLVPTGPRARIGFLSDAAVLSGAGARHHGQE